MASHVVDVLKTGGDFVHGFTYSGHPVAAAGHHVLVIRPRLFGGLVLFPVLIDMDLHVHLHLQRVLRPDIDVDRLAAAQKGQNAPRGRQC